MDFKEFTKILLTDIKVDLTQEFDKNFERNAFFNKKWPRQRYPNSRGSMMQRSGKLRRSIKSHIKGSALAFTSNMPYADIQNNGGTIKVTAKMKRYFWAMYYKSYGAITYSVKSKKAANTQRNKKLSDEAEKWRAMALLPVGTKMKIEKRQLIGHHTQVDNIVKEIVEHNFKEFAQEIGNHFNK